jgi:hypothetical protein
MPERIRLHELRLEDYNGNRADLSGSVAALMLDDDSGEQWRIVAETDQQAYFDPVASFYNAQMVADDGRAFKGEVRLLMLRPDSEQSATIVLAGNRELLGYTPTPHTERSEGDTSEGAPG